MKQEPNVGPGSYETKDFFDQKRNKVNITRKAYFAWNLIDL